MIDTESLSDTVTKAIHTFCELPTGECEDCYSFSLDVRVHNITSPPEQVFLAAWRHSSAGVMPVELDPQTPIGRYFADFSVSALDYFVNAWFKLPLQTLEEISKIAPRYAIVTNKENILRGVKGVYFASNSCAHGHAFTAENTKIKVYKGKPRRICRVCLRAYKRSYYSKSKLANTNQVSGPFLFGNYILDSLNRFC